MTSPMLLRASKRVESCQTQREQAFAAWVEASPGTDDNGTLWLAYERAREEETGALVSFHSLWREFERVRDGGLLAQLEATARAVEMAKQEARR